MREADDELSFVSRALEFRSRLTDLRARAFESADPLPELEETLEELSISLEEVSAAQESLVVQANALRSERLRYRDLFEFAPDAYVETASDGVVRLANRAAASLFGVPADELRGRELSDFAATDADRAELRTELARARRIAPRGERIVGFARPDGATFAGSIVSAPMRADDHRTLSGVRWLVRDVTRRIETEQEIRRLNAELEDRVAERTHQLEDALAAKNRLLAVIAHELRNPLGAIMASMAALERLDPGAPAAQSARRIILRQVRQQQRLVNDLLDESRLAEGKLCLDLAPTDLRDVVAAALEDWREPIADAGFRVDAEFPGEAVMVRADVDRLRQVLGNLLDNALKVGHAGGCIVIRMTGDADGQASVTVSDDGCGIAAEDLPRLTDPFFQVGGSARAKPGLGLGLALVKSLVELHGGTVLIRSDGAGMGAQIEVRLPRYEGTA